MFKLTNLTAAILCVNLVLFTFCAAPACSGKPSNISRRSAFEKRANLETPLPGLAPSGLTTTVSWVHATLRLMGTVAAVIVFLIQPVISGAVYGSGSYDRFWDSSNNGRSLKSFLDKIEAAETKFQGRGLLDKDNCVEKIRCAVNGIAKRSSHAFGSYVNQYQTGQGQQGQEQEQQTGWTNAWENEVGVGRQTYDCGSLRCNPVGFVFRLFIYLIDWNTMLKA